MQRNIKIDAINPYLVCTLCSGYLIDATTLVECLHSFCKSCLLRYLERSYNCPKCSMEIHKTKPLEYIRSDPCLQEIVYKLVPDLFAKEEKRRHAWKKQDENSNEPGPSVIQDEPPDDNRILVTLKYFRGTSRMERIKTEKVLQMFPTRYLCCNPEMPVRVLKKFVCLKFDISPDLFQVELWRGDETLVDELTMKQLVQIYGLYRERKPLDLHFSLYPKFDTKPSKDTPVDDKRNIPKFDPVAQMKRSVEQISKENDVPNEPNKKEVKEETTPPPLDHKDTPSRCIDSPTVEDEQHKSESVNKINLSGQSAKRDDLHEKAGTSRLNENLLLKEELKRLTSSTKNLNTTDSDSSQKSNVSSLDVNLLMEEDFKPETLENEFLKLFDSDSQHNYDIDGSCFDANLSIDSDMEKITKTMGNDILNLFDNDSQFDGNLSMDQDITNLPKDQSNDINLFAEVNSGKPSAILEANTWNNNEAKHNTNATSDVINNKLTDDKSVKEEKSQFFVPTPNINVSVDELREDIPESPSINDACIPKLPELSDASNLHCDNRDRIPVTKQKPIGICLSSTPTTIKDAGNSQVSGATFQLTENKDSAIEMVSTNFNMSKLRSELNSESPIVHGPVSNKNNIENNHLNGTPNPHISLIEPGLIITDNSEATFESDMIIKLLESDTQNDSDVNSSAENDIMDISASLEKDLQNLLNSERRENIGNSERRENIGNSGRRENIGNSERRENIGNSERRENIGNSERRENIGNSERRENIGNSISNINAPINVPIPSFPMRNISTSIPTPQLQHEHDFQKFQDKYVTNGNTQDSVSSSNADYDEENEKVQHIQPLINVSPLTNTSNDNITPSKNVSVNVTLYTNLPNDDNITCSDEDISTSDKSLSVRVTIPDVITPSAGNEYINTKLNENNSTQLSDLFVDDREKGDDLVIEEVAMVCVDDNSACVMVSENPVNLDGYTKSEEVVASLEECTLSVGNLTSVEPLNEQVNGSSSSCSSSVDSANDYVSINVSSCTNLVVSVDSIADTLLSSIGEYNINTLGNIQAMDET